MQSSTRRKFIRAVGVAGAVTIAGCSTVSDGENTTPRDSEPVDDGDQQPTTENESNSSPKEATGRVEDNEVDGLEVVDWSSAAYPDRSLFEVTLTVKNVGNEQTDIFSYYWNIIVYDENGEKIDSTSHSDVTQDAKLKPGETTKMQTGRNLENPDTVASYGIQVLCTGEGAYCSSE